MYSSGIEVWHLLAMLCGEGMYVMLWVRQDTGSTYLTESKIMLTNYVVAILTRITVMGDTSHSTGIRLLPCVFPAALLAMNNSKGAQVV